MKCSTCYIEHWDDVFASCPDEAGELALVDSCFAYTNPKLKKRQHYSECMETKLRGLCGL